MAYMAICTRHAHEWILKLAKNEYYPVENWENPPLTNLYNRWLVEVNYSEDRERKDGKEQGHHVWWCYESCRWACKRNKSKYWYHT